ncbi:MAG TPA: MFS transporter, partial [Eggerthellaceae bacterium]|nr:MFS transporter [Eggerthellaceae bacterium]
MMKRHYEKVIVGCCFAFIFVNIGLASTAFSVHQPYLVAMEGIGDTGGSLVLSARTFTSFVAMLVVDRYYALLDARRGVFVACLCTAAGFAIYSTATSLPQFIGGAIALGIGYGFGGLVAMTMLVNRWFASGIGSAMGVATMGSGVASIVMPLVVVRVIEASSLSAAFLVEAAVALVVGLAAVLLLRNRPSDMGMEAYAGPAGKTRKRARHELRPCPRSDQALLLVAMLLLGAYCCGGVTYLSVLATSSGFEPVFAASLVALAGVALTAAKFATGELFDHLGTPLASAIVFALGAIGFSLCCFAGTGSTAVMLAAAVLVGVGLSLGSVGISVWSLDTADPSATTRQVKNFQVAYALGGFLANTLPGIVKD